MDEMYMLHACSFILEVFTQNTIVSHYYELLQLPHKTCKKNHISEAWSVYIKCGRYPQLMNLSLKMNTHMHVKILTARNVLI